MKSLPEIGYVRLCQIIGRREITKEQADANRAAGTGRQRPCEAIPAIIPLSATAWWRGVKCGRYPQPIKVGASTLWRAEDVRALVESIGAPLSQLAANRHGGR